MSYDRLKNVGVCFFIALALSVGVYCYFTPDSSLNQSYSFGEFKDDLEESSLVVGLKKVFGGEEEPTLDTFQPSDVPGGWKYYEGNKTYTAYSVKEYLGKNENGEKLYSSTTYSTPEFIKEDNVLKNKREARSLKGYYEVIRLDEGLGYGEIEHDDWNWTSVSFRVKLLDNVQGRVLKGVSIPLKLDGKEDVRVTLENVNELSSLITLTNTDGIVGHNWTFNPTYTLTSVDNNVSFKDNYIWSHTGSTGGFSYFDQNLGRHPSVRTYGAGVGTTKEIGIVCANLTEFYGDVIYSNITWIPTVNTVEAPGGVDAQTTFKLLKQVTWVEGSCSATGTCNETSNWIRPDNFSDPWTTGTGVGSVHLNPEYEGEIIAIQSYPNGYTGLTALEFNYTDSYTNINNFISTYHSFCFTFNITSNSADDTVRYDSIQGTVPWSVYVEYVSSNNPPTCTQTNTNITVDEDSGAWVLDENMSEAINISCTDIDSDALTFTELDETGSGGTFSITDNSQINFATSPNATGTRVEVIEVSDGTATIEISAQVTVTGINDPPWWDEIINGSTTKIKTGYDYQPIDVNASQYFRDVEDDQTPTNITISVNESSVDCMMNTVNNFTIFCKPDSVSVFIITLTSSTATTSFEEFVAYPPSTPVITLPITTIYHGNNTLTWTASVSPQEDEIAFYNLTINFGPTPYVDWYYTIAEMNATSYSWDFKEIRDDMSNEYYLQIDVCDNNSLCTYGLSSGFSVNNTPHWDNIGNDTASFIKINFGEQPVLNNVSQYFHDYFDDQTPNEIIVSDNETAVSCTIATNLSLFCTPTTFKGDFIITLNGTNSVANSSFESFEGYVTNTAPTIPNILSPEQNALNDTIQLNLTCTGSTDTDEDILYYDFLGDTTTTPTTSICLNTGGECLWNYTTIEQSSTLYWSCAANDTYENSSFTTPRSIYTNTYDIINQTQSYNEYLVSTDNIRLESNVTWNEIRYNNIEAKVNLTAGTYYTTTKTQHDNWTHFIVTIPFNQSSSENQGFTWNYTLTYHNLTLYENHTYEGSIPYHLLYLMNCSDTNTSILLNVTGFHEDTDELLGISLEGIFEIWTNNYEYRNVQTFDLNATDYNVTEGFDSYYFCLSYDTPINLSSYMQYSTPGGFAQRWYINKQAYQNNTNNEIHLYDRDYTAGISDLKGTIRYKDSYSYFQNVYTQLYRYYPANNLWTYIQSDKSDEFGLIYFNIKEVTNDYKLLFYDTDNHLLLQTTSSKFTCDTTTFICEITFLLDAWSEGTTTYKTPLSWSYDNATGLISVTWNDLTSTISNLRVLVTKETMGGTTTVCDGTTASASGTYTCNVSAYDGQLLLRAYQTASPEGNPLIYEWITRPINKLFQFLPLKESVVWAVSLSITTAIFGIIISPAAGIIMFITSLVIISMMGLAGFVTIGFITFAVILGVIIGLKVRS